MGGVEGPCIFLKSLAKYKVKVEFLQSFSMQFCPCHQHYLVAVAGLQRSSLLLKWARRKCFLCQICFIPNPIHIPSTKAPTTIQKLQQDIIKEKNKI